MKCMGGVCMECIGGGAWSAQRDVGDEEGAHARCVEGCARCAYEMQKGDVWNAWGKDA